jgi:hypothetical protein
MRNIVYILGAGFSAPAGIPVMSDFLRAAQDIRQNHPGDGPYSYFGRVLDQFATPTKILPYYKADTFNIEEILSILEMESLVTQKPGKTKIFEKFITDVIDYHSASWKSNKIEPLLQSLQLIASNHPLIDLYVPFVLNIFQCDLELRDDIRYDKGKMRFVLKPREQGLNQPSYSIITLNYDLALEQALEYINQFVAPTHGLRWSTAQTDPGRSKKGPERLKSATTDERSKGVGVPLSHLHGCTNGLGIISPTWNKSRVGTKEKRDIFGNWLIAHEALQNANEIRFLGYSLPESDSYIKYLLKSAGLTCKNLQKISAICLDPNGDVEPRYLALFNQGRFRFAKEDLRTYLRGCGPQNGPTDGHVKPLPLPWTVRFDTLEQVHDAVLQRATGN